MPSEASDLAAEVPTPFKDFHDFRLRYDRSLPPWACRFTDAARPWGKRAKYDERLGYRTEFQMDRDDILYSRSFRQLAYKRQMLSDPDTVSFYTRLTHTLIVSQIARSIGRGLQLDENLTEAIALGHDLGHAPYGHSGEEGIERFLCKRVFPHLAKSLPESITRIPLEERFAREASQSSHPQSGATYQPSFLAPSMDDLQRHFYCRSTDHEMYSHHKQGYRLVRYLERSHHGFQLTLFTEYGILRCSGSTTDDDGFDLQYEAIDNRYASYEAQVVRVADDIAWANHDLTEDSHKLGETPGRLLNHYFDAASSSELRLHHDDLSEFFSRGPGERYGIFISDAIDFNKDKLLPLGFRITPERRKHIVALSPERADYLHDMKKIVAISIHGSPDMRDIAAASTRQVEEICGYLEDIDHFAALIPLELFRGKRPDSLTPIERLRAIVDAVSFMTDSEAETFDKKYLAPRRLPSNAPRKSERLSWLSD